MDLTAAKGLLYCLLGLFVLVAWARERRKRRLTGEPEKFWPGTTYAPAAAYYAAAAGAILITIAEAAVEKRAGLTDQQSVLPAVFLFQLLGASVVEEALFRGFVAPGELMGRKAPHADDRRFAGLRAHPQLRPEHGRRQSERDIRFHHLALALRRALQSAEPGSFAPALFYGPYRA